MNKSNVRDKNAFICDMDGVIYHGDRLLKGVTGFVEWLKKEKKRYLFLTNSSSRTPKQLKEKLSGFGLEIDEKHFMTSALATATFLKSQCPQGKAYIIGENALSEALCDASLRIGNTRPDYVVVGETKNYNYEKIETAINLVLKGAKLIGTNPDLTGPTEKGISPACRALISPIELATGRTAYFIGKPNPLIMRHSLKKLRSRRENTVIIGDRMDTDIIAGIESEIETVLVLSGITSKDDLQLFSYKPHYVFNHVGEICS